MHTELTFLIELLLEHKLQKPTKDAIAARIKDVETLSRPGASVPARVQVPTGAIQAASTLAIMERNPDLVPQPVTQIAQTPATAAALAHRQESIALAMSGKPEKGRTSPRKF